MFSIWVGVVKIENRMDVTRNKGGMVRARLGSEE